MKRLSLYDQATLRRALSWFDRETFRFIFLCSSRGRARAAAKGGAIPADLANHLRATLKSWRELRGCKR